MSLKGIAQETLKILEAGAYTSPSGQPRSIAAAQAHARAHTLLYTPAQGAALLGEPHTPTPVGYPASLNIQVLAMRTQEAALQLAQAGHQDILVLNFASARNPGGGFTNGAKAQEEDLCRCSGLYLCQLEQMDYYHANRDQASMLYTDHVIYSPDVPWFRARSRELLEEPFLASVITAPAPNAGQARRRSALVEPQLQETLARRAGIVLAIARAHKRRTLVLGAWGCGVFDNAPAQVAEVFDQWLQDARFADAFDRVVFAIYARDKHDKNLSAFERRFSSWL